MRRQEHRIEIKKRTSLFEKRNGKPDRVSKSEVFFKYVFGKAAVAGFADTSSEKFPKQEV